MSDLAHRTAALFRYRALLAAAAEVRSPSVVDEAALVRLLLLNGWNEGDIAERMRGQIGQVDCLFVLSEAPADVQDGVRVGRLTLDDALSAVA